MGINLNAPVSSEFLCPFLVEIGGLCFHTHASALNAIRQRDRFGELVPEYSAWYELVEI